jgi:elongator complex protein 3
LSNLRQLVEEKLHKKWVKLVDIRHREIKDKKNDPQNATIHTFEYEASEWKEYFITFEDKKDRTIFSLLRLRLPKIDENNKLYEVLPELSGAALIREIHTFWDQLSIWEAGSVFGQHLWFWKKLIETAENIAKNAWYKKMAVIAWVWVRWYYEKRWYQLEWEYMVKEI